ncbi:MULTISPECIES: hypothetical protein [unclassified Streptomyces]|uniref:hypothetical protein n=1 Tax=unclassified Streptomyces TaxID=2593676 RepID=UPI0011E77A8B|nr:hypothetical protein [Streptomyces sp. sk2.1]
MRMKNVVRSTAGLAVALGTVLALGTAPAYAANKSITLNNRGTATFTDSGDKFTVCDTNADGHGVQMSLYRVSDNKIMWTITDGGDSGCDSKTYDIVGSTQYYMHLCWSVPGAACVKSSNFSES